MSEQPKTLDDTQRRAARQAAGEAAATLVEPDMVVGLGTGDSAGWFIRALARRAAEGLRVARCVATSVRTAELAKELGLPLCDRDELPAGAAIDLTVDGADEIDPALRLIKGGGGALLREKLVAHSSRRLVIVADEAKRVPRLGLRFRLPLEIVPFGAAQTLGRLQRGFPGATLRLAADGTPQRSDGGNLLVDLPLLDDGVPLATLHERLKLTPGVLETGLFLDEAERALIGTADGSVQMLPRPPR